MPVYEVIIMKEQKEKHKFSFELKDGKGEGDSEKRIQQEQILLGPKTLTAKNKYAALLKAVSGMQTEVDPDEMEILIRPF